MYSTVNRRIFFALLAVVWIAACRPEPPRLRVMTYNIHHGSTADEEASLREIGGLIRTWEPDVVALQEVDRSWSERSGYADQAAELADRLGMHLFFGAIYDLEAEEESQLRRRYGLAILSRFPMVDSINHELTRLPTVGGETEERPMPGFVQATVDVRGTPVHVFNTHLDYRPDPRIRRRQVGEMLEIVSRFEGPVILTGDFNALPEAEELAPLHDRFVDAWGARRDGATYPADEPLKRIDAVFVSPGIVVDSVAVPPSTASDHRPVVADLVLR